MKSCITCKDAGKYHESTNPQAVFCGQLCQRIYHYVAIGGKTEKRSREEEESATTLEDYSKLPPDVKRLLMEYAPSLKELQRWCQKDRESGKLCHDPGFQIKWAKAHKENLRQEIANAFESHSDTLLKRWLVPAIQVNAWDPAAGDNSAIQWAADKGQWEFVRLLAGLPGVDPSANYNMPIRYAALEGNLEMVRFLASLPGMDPVDYGHDSILNAVDNGHLEVVRYLASLPGVDPSFDDNDIIQHAAKKGRLDVVRFLAGLPGVDPTDDDNGAIEYAAKRGHSDVVRFLLSLDHVRQTLSSDRLQEYQRMITRW